MRRFMAVAVLLFLMLLSCGCRSATAVSNQIIVTGLGIDSRDGRYVLSIQAIEALKTSGSLSEQSDTATAVYTAEGRSVAEALQAFLNEVGKETYILQNQIIVLSMAVCREQSLFTVLDYFMRNQEGRALVNLVVCRNDPAELLDIKTGNDAIPAEYVSQLLAEGHRWGRTVATRLLDAERASSGMYDLVLPLLEMNDDTPSLGGTVLFRHGELAGELTSAQTTGLLIAGDCPEYCFYTVENGAVRCEDIETNLTVAPQGSSWQYRLTVEMTVCVVEEKRRITQEKMSVMMRGLEEQIASDVVQALNSTVREHDCDPFGLARRTAAQYRSNGVTQQEVRTVLSESQFRVSVRLSLADSDVLT